MRYSDIAKLDWREIQHSSSEGYFIRFNQQKTDRPVTLPISDEAAELLGAKNARHGKIFHDLKKWDVDRLLPVWIRDANIDKHVTSTVSAIPMLSCRWHRAPIYLQYLKCWGTKTKTTQIYTKIIDEKKREATAKISFI